MCGDSNRIAPLRTLKCLKPGLRCMVLSFRSWSANFLTTSYVKAERKSLSSFIPSPELHICYVCVTLVYLFYISMINAAFMWHLCEMIAYMWHIYDETYSICWICNYVGDICDMYLVLVRVHSQLVAISHSLHIICIFSFLYIVGCIWFGANIFKIFSSEVNKCYL